MKIKRSCEQGNGRRKEIHSFSLFVYKKAAKTAPAIPRPMPAGAAVAMAAAPVAVSVAPDSVAEALSSSDPLSEPPVWEALGPDPAPPPPPVFVGSGPSVPEGDSSSPVSLAGELSAGPELETVMEPEGTRVEGAGSLGESERVGTSPVG